MARLKSTTLTAVDAEMSAIDMIVEIAENQGQRVPLQVIAKLLFDRQDEIRTAMFEAGKNVVRAEIFRMAGLTPKEISDATEEIVHAVVIAEVVPSSQGMGIVSAGTTPSKVKLTKTA